MFVGTYDFTSLTPLPAVKNNLAALGRLFTGTVWHLPSEHCSVVRNPVTPRELTKPVQVAAEAATDTLLIYYAGHGLIEPKTGEFHLAVLDSDKHSVHDTAAPYEWIRWAVESSRAARKVVILDCCYSARAFGVQSAEADLAVEGTYLLAASAETAVALAPPDEPYTAFTGELVQVLEAGIHSDAYLLDLDTIFRQLRTELRLKGRPEPQRLCRGEVGSFPFTTNPGYSSPAAAGGRAGGAASGTARPRRPGPARPSDNTEPYVRLASLRELHQAVALLNSARNMADTLQTVADGAVAALGFEMAAVNLVRPDGDLLVAVVAGSDTAEAALTGRTGSRESWERRLSMGERWGELRFIPYAEGWVLDHDDVPQWHTSGVDPRSPDDWHPGDRLFAPMYAADGELLAVLQVDQPRNGRRPGPWGCEALQMYAFQAAIAISNARLRGNLQRALIRLEQEQQALRGSEEGFRQAFEFAPSGMAIAEVGGENHGRLIRVNDALCRLLGRSAVALRRHSFTSLVHPDDADRFSTIATQRGRTELRLQRRDGSYAWFSLHSSVMADPSEGPRLMLTVDDIDERKHHETASAHRLSRDPLTRLPHSAEFRARLTGRLCDLSPHRDGSRLPGHTHVSVPGEHQQGLAVLYCDLTDLKSINVRLGHRIGETVLIEAARRLTTGVRQQDTVARLAGDEFAVLAEGVNRNDAAKLATHLGELLAQPVRVEGRTLRVTARLGISWARCGVSDDAILRAAATNAHHPPTADPPPPTRPAPRERPATG